MKNVALSKLKKNIKKIKDNSKSLKEFAKEKYVNSNGEAVINIYVNKDNLFEEFSSPDDRKINEDIFDYIDRESHFIPVEYPLVINIISEEKIENKDIIKNKIFEHYNAKFLDISDDKNKNTIIWISLFILGIILYSLYFFFIYAFEDKVLFNEIFSVAATFTIWEAVDYLLIQGNAINIDLLNMFQLMSATINVND